MMKTGSKMSAEVLVEALPYIQEYAGKIIVVKYGGNAMINEDLKQAVIEDIVLLNLVGIKVVLVHGGGPEISEMLKKTGKESKFVKGLRYTDRETMDIVQMILCGKVNKNLVSLFEKAGGHAVGLGGMDGGLFKAIQLVDPDGTEYGYVGDIKEVNEKVVLDVLNEGFIPVVSSVAAGMDEETNYNINADTVAAAVAASVEAEKLILLTDVEGIKDKDGNVIAEMHKNEIYEMIHDGSISGGMIPKVLGCLESIDGGVTGAHIIDGRIPHCLLLEIFTKTGIGTLIKSDKY